ncbi:hypothetical protein M9H77_14465 [Catharanthus roseus]|uniref:Uncharacterized protein n=1 Tax=Catharanthus roseus TaxID=4058 RepID=A0ACC0BN49_CATRO|nr:hypothetical protein M9H77_14465 [Catharanthus roseus]
MGEEYHDDEDHEICNTRLGLGISLDDFHVPKKISINRQKKKNSSIKLGLDVSFPFHNFKYDDKEIVIDDYHHKGCKIEEGSSSKTINGGGARKKLRLTKEQSTVLENSFKQHTTLNTFYNLEKDVFNFVAFYIGSSTCSKVGSNETTSDYRL